ncbi:MAG: alpha/beta fold hydrolase [Alphaproteobacteria bacterium]|nr:alpha/beta fold hydrolase [Alphaproteobacteria bacterium]
MLGRYAAAMPAVLFAAMTISACAQTSLPLPMAASATPLAPVALPAGVTMKEANWHSEQVRVSGRLFLPATSGAPEKAGAVVLAPGRGETAETLDAYAVALAREGVAALSIDYRGWGRSGGFLYLGERVQTYDAMRFSEHTPEMVIRRGRVDPEQQVQDIRNAVTFLQSQSGIDRSRIGVLGLDLAGGHVISAMGMDARIKAGAAVTPVIAGASVEMLSFRPDAASRALMIRLARDGAPPRTAAAARIRNAEESRLAIGEYMPFWRIGAIPETASIQFIVAGADREIDNTSHALAASRALKGPSDVQTLPGAGHDFTFEETARAAGLAAGWFKSKL